MRRVVAFLLAAVSLVAAGVVACDSDDEFAGRAGSDAGEPDSASAGRTDASPADGGLTDAEPTLTESLGTTGVVRLFSDGVQADFHVDDTILRVSNAAECVAHVSSVSKGFSSVGTITVGGSIVGLDGGPDEPIEVTPDELNSYLHHGPVFPADALLTVQVALAGFGSAPAMPAQTLHLPSDLTLDVTEPVPTTTDGGQPPPPPPLDGGVIPTPPDGGAPEGERQVRTLDISSAVPFEIKWTVPSGPANPRVLVTYRDIAGLVAGKQVQLYCDYPAAQGGAVIPANLLSEIRKRVGENARGQFTVWSGDRKMYSASSQAGAVSYIVDVTRPTSTTLHPDGAYIEAKLK